MFHSTVKLTHTDFVCVFDLKAPNECSIFELVSSLRNSNDTENPIDIATENNSNHVFDDCNDNNENEENENLNAIRLTVGMPSEDEDFVEVDYEFEELTEQIEYSSQQTIDAEDMRNLHSNTNCTVIDVHCMIYAFLLRHNITWTAVNDLLLLSNQIIGKNVLQPSVHTFKKKIHKILKCDIIKHFVCRHCDLYLGTNEILNRLNIKFCPSCNNEIQMDTKYKKDYFITIPIEKHLQDILARNCDNLNLNIESSNTGIYDVHDAVYFQQLKMKMRNIPYITLIFSTDGAAKFKSCKEKSVWPLSFGINEISLEHRYKRENTFCAAISYGRTPKMQTFFRTFIQDINRINESGGLEIKLKNGEIQKIKIFPMIFTADTPARADVLMKSYFNGYKGCSFCLHSGSSVNKQVRYCKRNNGDSRTNDQVRKDMIEAQTTNSKVNGYKGMSPLMALEYFDLVWQVGIDKMHNIDLGVTPLLFTLFLDSANKKERLV